MLLTGSWISASASESFRVQCCWILQELSVLDTQIAGSMEPSWICSDFKLLSQLPPHQMLVLY